MTGVEDEATATAIGTAGSGVPAARAQGHLWIASNRLPVTVVESGDDPGDRKVVPSVGGLASGLRGFFETSSATWIGWPGAVSASGAADRGLAQQLAQHSLKLVSLDQTDVEGYYDGFSNGVLWPLFHYMLDRVPLQNQDWAAYQRVNRRFADVIVEHYRPGDTVWVHDYHLMLVPALVREQCPEARIGFFLHIPFPAPEVFRVLPWRRDLLAGVMGSDLVGFHTASYGRHFVAAVQGEFGVESGQDRIQFQGRTVRVGHFPMSPDVAQFTRLAALPAVQQAAAKIREESRGRFLFLGVDRLDYTKGIPRRLLAFERLLERNPGLRDKVRLIQLAVPSRNDVGGYASFRKRVEEAVGRINGAVGTLRSVPIHYLHRAVPPEQLTALYRAADAMLVTPLRDGMNLVAKEFVASRPDDDGVLLLSEFAGAAEELGEAVILNPYDVDGMADRMEQAMSMGRFERAVRMRALRQHVIGRDVADWARGFLAAASEAAEGRGQGRDRPRGPLEQQALLRRIGAATAVTLVLDYDGTLVGLRERPELAVPDPSLLRLLEALAAATHLQVHIASGRPREDLERWFGEIGVGLWAEHGLWHRPAPGTLWTRQAEVSVDWIPGIRAVLERAAALTPGARVEEKSASLAWHYRLAEPVMGARQASALRSELAGLIADQPLEILEGHLVLEIRTAAVDKGGVVRHVAERLPEGGVLVAIGDDRTDEDMFAALPEQGLGIRVGTGPSAATYRLASPADVRVLLGSLA